MEKELALAFIEKNKIDIESYNSVIVTSDNAVYLDSDLASIEAHCKEFGKTFCVVKGEKLEVEEIKEGEVKETKPKKKK